MNTFPPNRRDFLRLLGGAALAGALPSWLQAEGVSADFVNISILHTTDLHGHILPTSDYQGRSDLGGFARCVTQINRWRAQNPHSLLLDLGDVYQGTEFALADHGRGMIDLFNLCRYDAWLIGNHEFDWGIGPFLGALDRSQIPVLAANTVLEGRSPGSGFNSSHPFAKIQPFLIKEIAGIKLAVIGLTTPGMPFWFSPAFTAGIEFQDPIAPVRHALDQVKALGADAVILAGHMGLKSRTGGDDFANRVMALTAEFPEAHLFIAGHTHQDVPSRLTHGVPFTQADHFGIHVGQVNLLFDRASHKLLHLATRTELMDARIALDPLILSRTQPQLERAQALLAQPIGELAQTLRVKAKGSEPSELEVVLAAAFAETLLTSGAAVAGVFHGLFDRKHVFKKGRKTIGDIWEILPYENFLVTAELTPAELGAIMEEVWQSRQERSLVGFQLGAQGQGSQRRLTSVRRADGRPLDRGRRYRIALNTFDAQSAGHRFMKLRELLERPAAQRQFHPVQTREALIAYFRRQKTVRRLPQTLVFPAAA